MIARPGALLNVLANTLRDGHSLLTVGIRQQQTKFLASQSGKDVVIANAVFDNIHDRQNHAIPTRCPQLSLIDLKLSMSSIIMLVPFSVLSERTRGSAS